MVGDSNTAMDCARSSIRLGAQSVTVICPCERKDMTARKRDVDRALEEGVHICFMTRPVQIVGDINGDVTGIEYCRLVDDNRGSNKHRNIIKGSHIEE